MDKPSSARKAFNQAIPAARKVTPEEAAKIAQQARDSRQIKVFVVKGNRS